MSRNRTQSQKAREAQRALELHSQGLTERDIARRMSDEGMPITQPTVNRRIKYAVQAYVTPAGAEAVNLELARLDAVLSAMADRLRAGDPKAADVVIKTVALRCKLLGLEPTKITEVVTGPQPALLQAMREHQQRALGSGSNA